MTRNSKELLALALGLGLGLGLSACQGKGGTLAPTVTIVSPANGTTLMADAGTVAACVLTTTVTVQTTGIANGAFGNLTVNGVAAGTSQVASGTLTFTNVPLNGSDAGTTDVIVVTVDGLTATATVTVMLNCGGTTCADAGMPTLAFTKPVPDAGFNLSQTQGAPGLWLTFNLTTTNATSGSIEVCSTVAPSASAAACHFGSGLFEVGTTTPSNGSATLTAPVGDDGSAPNQTISAQLTSPCGDASASVEVQAHALQPVIQSVLVQPAFDGGGGCLWLNASNLDDAGLAATTIVVTADAGDTFGDGGAVLSITGTANLMDSAALTGSSSPSATIPISLSNGAYNVSATVTDVWGNQSAPDLVQICVKTTLPNCILSDSPSYSNGCFNIVDNGGLASDGGVPVALTVTAGNVSGTDVSGSPVDGTALVLVNGSGRDGGPIASVLTIGIVSDQGPDVYSASVTDPAGNPTAACTPASLDLTVSTLGPTFTVVSNGGTGVDANGCEIYTTRDGIPISLTTPNVANGGSINIVVTGANGGSSADYQTTVASGTASVTASAVPNGIDTVMVSGKDACGNKGTGTACIDVQATGCDLSFVSPIPTMNSSGELLLFNASEVSDAGSAGIELHTSCAAGTQVQFSDTPLNGSAQPQIAMVDANGNVTFDLSDLVDGSSGTFTASISGGETLPAISYYVKLSLPSFAGETPASADLEIVASQDNLILEDAGVTELVTSDGGIIIANQVQCATNACADFVLTGVTGLGPVDGTGHIGTATLTLNFPGQTTNNPNPIDVTAGSNSVTFSAVSLPAVSYPTVGTVTLTLTDTVGNVTTETWNVITDTLQPPAPSPTAGMSDPRAAAVKLSWAVPAGNGDSNTEGYELAYVINYFNVTAPANVSEANYPRSVISSPQQTVWTLDPGIAVLNGAAGPNLTYTESNIPTLNQYTFELRTIDQVGNRSALAPTVTASSVSTVAAPDPNAWQTVTVTDPDASGESDFGYVLRTGDFNGDGMQDLAITAPGQYEPNPTPGTVYIMNGAAAANLAKVTFAGMTAITLGGTDYDWFGQDAHVAKFNNPKAAFDDLAVGSPEWDGGQGRVDIFFGGANGIASTPSATIVGDSSQAGLFGYSVSSADVDGDGIADLLVGAPGMGASGNGASYLFLGKNGYKTGMDLTSATSVITGNAGDGVGARWGSVDIGDINADGDEDFTVSAPGGGGTDGFDGGTGTVYGFSGATALANATMTVATNALFALTPNHTPAYCDPQVFGYASGQGDEASTFWACFGVNAIGDVNFTGGNLPDLVVASDYYSAVYIYTMGKAGPTNVATAPNLQDQTSALGWSMVALDMNLDKQNDLLIGENGNGNNNVFLYLNSARTFTSYPNGELFGADEGFGYGLAEADFENLGNGKKDFAISDWLTQSVTVYY